MAVPPFQCQVGRPSVTVGRPGTDWRLPVIIRLDMIGKGIRCRLWSGRSQKQAQRKTPNEKSKMPIDRNELRIGDSRFSL